MRAQHEVWYWISNSRQAPNEPNAIDPFYVWTTEVLQVKARGGKKRGVSTMSPEAERQSALRFHLSHSLKWAPQLMIVSARPEFCAGPFAF